MGDWNDGRGKKILAVDQVVERSRCVLLCLEVIRSLDNLSRYTSSSSMMSNPFFIQKGDEKALQIDWRAGREVIFQIQISKYRLIVLLIRRLIG